MLDFLAAKFLSAFQKITLVESLAVFGQDQTPEQLAKQERQLRQALADLREVCSHLPVTDTLVEQVGRAAEDATLTKGSHYMVATAARLSEIRLNLVSELRKHTFYCIPGVGALYGARSRDEAVWRESRR